MCDQTEVSYLPGDIVWVKLGPVWWPGKVCNNDEIPQEILKELRKPPIAIVKFFQEESFEYVKKLSNIYHYNCLKKNDFIKKGLDMCRSSNRDTPSNMKLFPQDVATAEVLTKGNPDIIHDEMFEPEKKPSYAAEFAPTPKKTPKKMKIERKKETPTPKPVTPRVITHPRFIRQGICDYEARERKQVPLRAECDEEDNSPPTTYRCPDCDFTTIRLNVIVLHNKSHVHNYAAQHTSVKGIKRKSTSTIRHKEKRPTIERKSTDIVKTKTPKTPSEKPKTPQKKSPVIQTKPIDSTLPKAVEVHKSVAKKRKPQPNTDEFQNSLLEDWAEFENEQEVNEDSIVSEDLNESTASSSKTGKSCFDFDDSEDGLVIEKSKIRAGRKIPRVLDDTRSDKDEDSNAFSEQSNSMDDQISSSDGNRNGIDSNDENEFAETRKTSQLQEMGVDNEIEIDSEEVNDSKDECDVDTTTIDIPLPPEPDEIAKPDPEKEREAEELKQRVDKLLEEISAPSKLPDVPYSVKKAHIKSFNESEELARREAEKNLAAVTSKVEPPEEAEIPKSETVKATVTEITRSVGNLPEEESKSEILEISEPDVVEVANSEPVEPIKPNFSQPVEPVIEEATQVINNTEDEVVTPSTPPQPTPPVDIAKSSSGQDAEQNAKPIKIVVGSTGSANQIVLSAATANNATPMKTIPAGQVKVVASKFKFINQSSLNKGVVSPTKVIAATTGTSVDGKTLVNLQSPQKFIINKTKSIIVPGPKIRFLGPNILQKTTVARAQVAAAAAAGVKTPTKSITLPSNMSGGSVVLLHPQKPIVLANPSTESASAINSTTPAIADTTTTEVTYLTDDAVASAAKTYQVVNTVATSVNNTAQIVTVDLNQTNNLYITDQSGNLIISDGTAVPQAPKEDILAKALENTDVLQSDIALTDVSQSVLDTISVSQNTPLTFKTDAVYDTNLTLNTPPIMSSFETPSRALNPAAVLAEAVSNEMIILNDNNEFVT